MLDELLISGELQEPSKKVGSPKLALQPAECAAAALTQAAGTQAISKAIEAQDRLIEEEKLGIVETALGTNEF